MSSWKRPDSVPHPKVWRRVVGRKPVNGKIPSFVIQDVPKDREEELLDFMKQHFATNDPIDKSLNIINDAASLKELRDLNTEFLAQKLSLVAFLEDDGPRPRIAGVNILGVTTRAEKDIKRELKGENTKKLFRFLEFLEDKVDPFEKYGVEEYITSVGLSVSKEFQGQGLGQELLKTRFDVGRAVGVKLTVTAFTAIESQVLAIREGFEELARVKYSDYKVDGKEVFPGINSEYCLLMAKKIE